MNRRQFLSKSAILLAAGSIVSQCQFAGTTVKLNKGRIGIQLYSIKDELPKDFIGSLKKLSDMGYSSVETWGLKDGKFFDHSMEEFSKLLKDMGMTISGTHAGSRILTEDTNAKEWDYWKICSMLSKQEAENM